MEKKSQLSSFALHMLAMLLMLCDHLWATVVPGQLWMTAVGRLAFPIFAFLLAEGFYRSSDVGRYKKRLLLMALLSEIPFNLMLGGGWLYPFHQNVLWTFLIALLVMERLEKLRQGEHGPWGKILGSAGACLLGTVTATVCLTDYGGAGVLTVLIFYFFRGRTWPVRLAQLGAMIFVHGYLLSGMDIPLRLMGRELFLPLQSLAVLALPLLWLYRGKQGPHGPAVRGLFYGFYPLHMLLLSLWALWG